MYINNSKRVIEEVDDLSGLDWNSKSISQTISAISMDDVSICGHQSLTENEEIDVEVFEKILMGLLRFSFVFCNFNEWLPGSNCCLFFKVEPS